MTDYKPGTVAVATVHGIPNTRVVRSVNRVWFTAEPVEVDRIGEYDHDDKDVTDVRPLVVLDLDGVTAVAALRTCADDAAVAGDAFSAKNARDLADQIEAQTKPPKPAEPKGWGTVVTASNPRPGSRWIRGDKGWTNLDAQGNYLNWSDWADIENPVLIREGVEA